MLGMGSCYCRCSPVMPDFVTTVKYDSDGNVQWWVDSEKSLNNGVMYGGYYYELAGQSSPATVITLRKIDTSDGSIVASVDLGHSGYAPSAVLNTNGKLVVVAATGSFIHNVYMASIDPGTLGVLWQKDATSSYSFGFNMQQNARFYGDLAYLKRAAFIPLLGTVYFIDAYDSGVLQWSIRCDEPLTLSEAITSFGDYFGGHIAMSGRLDEAVASAFPSPSNFGAWRYNNVPARTASWNAPYPAQFGQPQATKASPDGTAIWVPHLGYITALDSTLTQMFSPTAIGGGLTPITGDTRYGNYYWIGVNNVYRVTPAGSFTTRWVSDGTSGNQLRKFAYDGDQSVFAIVHHGGYLRKYDNSSAPATLLWTLGTVPTSTQIFYDYQSLEIDSDGSVYTTGGRIPSSSLSMSAT